MDLEEAIDILGNLTANQHILEDDEIISLTTKANRGFGPNEFPVDMDKSIRPYARRARGFWWQSVARGLEGQLRVLFQPPVDKREISPHLPNSNTSVQIVAARTMRLLSNSHKTLDFNKIGQTDYMQLGIFFDDLMGLMNIKDIGYDVKADGSGGQNLERMQRTRKAWVINDDGVLNMEVRPVFQAMDQPRGNVFLGDQIIAPPNTWIHPAYDEYPRLYLFYFGGDAANLTENKGLARRIHNDFNAKIHSDWPNVHNPDQYILGEEVPMSAILGLTLSLSAQQSFGSNWISENLFCLKNVDGFSTHSAFNGISSTELPKYIEFTIDSKDFGGAFANKESVIRKYRVLAPQHTLKIDQFNQPEKRWYVLDEYGYDLNEECGDGPGIRSHNFLYNE